MNKTVRLPDGRFITRKVVESDPSALAEAKPEEIWTMNDGKSNSGKTTYTRDILVADMETSHIVNAMATLVARARAKIVACGMKPPVDDKLYDEGAASQMFPAYRTMRDELAYRLGQKKRAPEPVPEHAGRKFDFS